MLIIVVGLCHKGLGGRIIVAMDQTTLDWLLAGDPSIRWQVMRDLLSQPVPVYEIERARLAITGWGADLLSRQDPDGRWGGGIYSPKWISTTYTLLLLRQLGLTRGHPQALRALDLFYFRGLEKDGGINWFKSYKYSETCVNGMILTLLSYFGHPDERIHSVAAHLLREQMPDGGWNCDRPRGATHASFHTTISVLEGFSEYLRAYPQAPVDPCPAVSAAHEFLLQHHLYQSHHTGNPADPTMTHMYFPPHWHYDFLRGLDYFQSVRARQDERMLPAIDLLRSKQTPNGCWQMNPPWQGKVFFRIEGAGKPSRWNTLRALRVLKWWDGEPNPAGL